ncbi:nucleoside monophosphate kinase [Microcoleus sp. bin38.metabat.b11b12b14.051]|uniref:adenylate kinase family protein n=1 Tax=Microcoleus sp. bin38.metabat.b11b12b14.051 TaxID=2742709 RepID=UPI0025D318E0|nr:nucleoside monophosphate kinase [Microcoleus sp. bin38.metabat.b11b12b14.051]
MRLVILGGPGAGKGTQAEQLCNNLSIPLLALGDILRAQIAGETDLGKLAVPYVEKGELVPDDILIRFIGRRLLLWDVFNGWVLEGYPRTAFQAEELDFLLEDLAQEIDWAIWLKVPTEVLLSRSIDRARSDDEPEILQRRLDLFEERTIPILEYYEYRHKLLTINGDQSPEQVQQDILAIIEANSH